MADPADMQLRGMIKHLQPEIVALAHKIESTIITADPRPDVVSMALALVIGRDIGRNARSTDLHRINTGVALTVRMITLAAHDTANAMYGTPPERKDG